METGKNQSAEHTDQIQLYRNIHGPLLSNLTPNPLSSLEPVMMYSILDIFDILLKYNVSQLLFFSYISVIWYYIIDNITDVEMVLVCNKHTKLQLSSEMMLNNIYNEWFR